MMTVPSNARTLPLLSAAWIALAVVHGALQFTAPRSAASDGLLPIWARVSLLATEGILLALLLLGAATLFRLIRLAGDRVPPVFRSLLRGVRSLLAVLLTIGLSASWCTFWMSGQFLDSRGLEFASTNFSSVFGYAVRLHPFLVYGLPWMIALLTVAACEAFPWWASTLNPKIWTGVRRLATTGLAAALAAVVVGEVAHRFATEKVTDPLTGATYSPDGLYRLRRERNAGPLTHLLSACLGSRDPFKEEAFESSPLLLRRPIETMDQYLARVDRDRVNRWNVIVVIVDSLRADQLRAAGGEREVMPALEALARNGCVFADCVTPASHTDYAAPAVFSSHYPLRSRDIYRYPKDPAYPRVMIYDVLKALGWRTALFSSEDEEWGQMTNYLQTGGLDILFDARSAGVSSAATVDRPTFAGAVDDSITVSEALKWIEGSNGGPFFLYLNLQNSHLPYDVPRGFPRRFSPKELDFKISVAGYPREKTETVRGVYADSLSYVDAQLDRLFGRLKDRGLWEQTLIVVCGDHGEAFFEHGFAAHANGVYEEVVKVPLILRAPGLAPGVDGRPAHLLDVAPGVFHLLGLPIHPSFQGEDLFSPSPRADRTRYAISDTPWKTSIGVFRAGFKLVRDADSGVAVLYDLRTDPAEKHDASPVHPEIARDLRARLSAWRRAQLEYYDNSVRQAIEYPPVLREP